MQKKQHNYPPQLGPTVLFALLVLISKNGTELIIEPT